jgi:acetyl esterase/lipase
MQTIANQPANPLRKIILLIFVFLFLASGFNTIHTATAQSQTLLDLEYARLGNKRLLLDLYVPAGAGPFPLIVWVHGGAWLGGDKDDTPAIRQVNRGYAVASINYRLSFEAKFPAQIEDCKAAVRWLRANAAPYKLDPNRIGAWGSSAGGHLVALLGTSGEVSDLEGNLGNQGFSSRVQAVVDWYGPTDLLKMNEQKLACDLVNHDAVFSPESLLIGCAIQTCADQTNRANPIAYITPDDPPFLIVHGTNDCLVSPQQSQILHNALNAASLNSTLFYIQGAGHGGDAFDRPEIQTLVDNFLDSKLKVLASLPKITGAQVSGKKLFVYGAGFDNGAKIFLNGEKQKTANDELAPITTLIAKKAGKKIAAGQTVMLQVKNADGKISPEFTFTQPF